MSQGRVARFPILRSVPCSHVYRMEFFMYSLHNITQRSWPRLIFSHDSMLYHRRSGLTRSMDDSTIPRVHHWQNWSVSPRVDVGPDCHRKTRVTAICTSIHRRVGWYSSFSWFPTCCDPFSSCAGRGPWTAVQGINTVTIFQLFCEYFRNVRRWQV